MTADRCDELKFLLQAEVDGELDVAAAASVAAHVASCPDCAAMQTALTGLSARVRSKATYHAAPAALRDALAATIAAAQSLPVQSPPVQSPPAEAQPAKPRGHGQAVAGWRDRVRSWGGVSFGAGASFGLAAAAAFALLLPHSGDFADSVIASHIRALQPGHLMDVVSTDQHTVKPWFDGRLDYAPPVKDLAAHGFPLVGGRLDYLDDRPVAALAYRRALHVIDLYIWPTRSGLAIPPAGDDASGYHALHWTQDGMAFWAVSDLNPAELGEFAELWRNAR